MSEVLNPAQVTAKYVATMGGTLGESFAILHNHVAWLYAKWNDYQYLFDSAPRIDLLNSTAGPFFHDLQIWLHESILLHMRRLADPAQSAGKDNLSLKGFGELLRTRGDQTCSVAFDLAVAAVDANTSFAKDWRNKRIAHLPLPAFAGGVDTILPVAGFADIDAGVRSIGHAMNCVHKHYLGHEIHWHGPIGNSVGVISLIHCLRKGLESQRTRDAARLP